MTSYRKAGVDIDAGHRLVQAIEAPVMMTKRPEVLSTIGGFGGLFALNSQRYHRPILVASTDGVGTKLELAQQWGRHQDIGIDLVAMCVNDVITQGAEPLFFLDYYATGHLHVELAQTVIESISCGCQQAGAALLGGETAEMPGFYPDKRYDLAGFCVGVVDQSRLITPQKVCEGDQLIAICSNGPHANGYSLIRALLKQFDPDIDAVFDPSESRTLAEALLAPTRIYVKSLLSLYQHVDLHGVAHITGGGLIDNVPRMLPDTLSAHIDRRSWDAPPIFRWIQRHASLETAEMLRTFNCGVGLVVCVDPVDVDACLQHLHELGEKAWIIGEVIPRLEQEGEFLWS